MTASDLINLSSLIDDAKCFELIRQHRWPSGVRCSACDGTSVVRNGHDETQPHRQRYRCNGCGIRFGDLTGTVLAGHHQPVRVWVLCPYFMGLNLSNLQIARELGLNGDDVGQSRRRSKKGRPGRRRRLRGERGRGTLEKEKPPVFGMIQRGGQVVIRMLPNVQQRTIEPIITQCVAPGAHQHR